MCLCAEVLYIILKLENRDVSQETRKTRYDIYSLVIVLSML